MYCNVCFEKGVLQYLCLGKDVLQYLCLGKGVLLRKYLDSNVQNFLETWSKLTFKLEKMKKCKMINWIRLIVILVLLVLLKKTLLWLWCGGGGGWWSVFKKIFFVKVWWSWASTPSLWLCVFLRLSLLRSTQASGMWTPEGTIAWSFRWKGLRCNFKYKWTTD